MENIAAETGGRPSESDDLVVGACELREGRKLVIAGGAALLS